MRFRIYPFFVISLLMVFNNGLAQSAYNHSKEVIYLTNPSFEDIPDNSKPPIGWADCGFPGETAPDVQPAGRRGFEVVKPAQEGYTYLGMVVRDNDTWESVGQRLSRPLEKGKCYEFSIYLARSELYISLSKLLNDTVNYITPTKLRVYGGFDVCDRNYLLAETNIITHYRWIEYRLKLEPIANYSHIIFEAFYKTPTLFPYNGNLLLDNASELVVVPCEEPDSVLLAMNDTPAISPQPILETAENVNTPKGTPEPPKEAEIVESNISTPNKTVEVPNQLPKNYSNPIVTNEKPAPKIGGLTRAELKKGTTIRIDKLYFAADKTAVLESSYPVLDEVYGFLEANKDVVVEIGGHTNGLPPHDYCDKLSSDRAEAISQYLSAKGISGNRLQFKGYGKRKPIATNKTEWGRRQNQRVEIKILDFTD